MGVGFGKFGILHVGGVFNRAEYAVIGEALISALEALRSSEGVVVCKETWSLVDIHFSGEKIEGSPNRQIKSLAGAGVRLSNTNLY